MAINGVGHNYDYLGTTTNYIRGKATVREAISKMVKQSANLSISDAGRNMLREMASKFEPDSDYTNVRELTIQNTNEVAWEHYTAMRDISSLTLKDGNYNVEDVMKSIMDTYETRYNEIVKEHENGDREVSYELTGKRSLTLDEDLAGLDEAFKMRLANLEGYITCQQTNKAFENGTNARNVLESCMTDRAQADLEQIQALVDGGMTRKEAAAQFTTEERFQSWLKEFRGKLEESIQ